MEFIGYQSIQTLWLQRGVRVKSVSRMIQKKKYLSQDQVLIIQKIKLMDNILSQIFAQMEQSNTKKKLIKNLRKNQSPQVQDNTKFRVNSARSSFINDHQIKAFQKY